MPALHEQDESVGPRVTAASLYNMSTADTEEHQAYDDTTGAAYQYNHQVTDTSSNNFIHDEQVWSATVILTIQ